MMMTGKTMMTMTTAEAQGYRLTYYRVAANLTQLDLYDMVGVTPSTLRSWERGATTIKCSVLPDLCAALGVTPNDIIAPTRFDPAERMCAVTQTSQAARKDDAARAELTGWLTFVRKRRGLTCEALAKLAHTCPSDINKYERLGYNVRPETLLRLYAALDIHFDPIEGEWVA